MHITVNVPPPAENTYTLSLTQRQLDALWALASRVGGGYGNAPTLTPYSDRWFSGDGRQVPGACRKLTSELYRDLQKHVVQR